MNINLPIDPLLPELTRILDSHRAVVLQAEPGAGKTTRVPLACLSCEWLGDKKILMLEPRRLAAQSAARYMSKQRGEGVGATIGYRIRGDAKVSKSTRIEVVTEGVLTRLLQEDPSLEGIGAIIFDEFHERGLHADLGLALVLEVQRIFREDLRIIVMSATLDGERVAALLGNAPILTSPGRAFPVEVRYLPELHGRYVEERVARAVHLALENNSGDILVFLPGRAEIQRTLTLLEAKRDDSLLILPLSSEQSEQEQQQALSPAPAGIRKVILSTSIAETSLTIEGVQVVIDAGLMRVPRYDPGRGMSTLVTIPVTQASAEQRKGRAGRTSKGVCYRLWASGEHASLARFNTPEILQTDLVPFALELAKWGSPDVSQFSFLDSPPSSVLTEARGILFNLGAINAEGGITAHGSAMHILGVHPRFAHMLLRGKELRLGALACDVAAILEERDLIRGKNQEIDLYSRWHILHTYRSSRYDSGVSRALLQRIIDQSERLRKVLGVSRDSTQGEGLGTLVALAFPERVGVQRTPQGNKYILRSGVGAELPAKSLLTREKFLAVADLDGGGAHARIYLTERISEEEIREIFADEIESISETVWNSAERSVRARVTERLGALVLSERVHKASEEEVREAMLFGIRQLGIECLPWNDESRNLAARIEWVRKSGLMKGTLAEFSPEALLERISEWLGPFLQNTRTIDALQKIDLVSALASSLTWDEKKEIDRLAPSHFVLPTGTNAPITYAGVENPTLSVRLQEMLGQAETPKIGDGRTALVLELLSPARRPLQVTRDLTSFWKNAYKEVRKEMVGRYPKHYWPENPSDAKPTRRVKAKM